MAVFPIRLLSLISSELEQLLCYCLIFTLSVCNSFLFFQNIRFLLFFLESQNWLLHNKAFFNSLQWQPNVMVYLPMLCLLQSAVNGRMIWTLPVPEKLNIPDGSWVVNDSILRFITWQSQTKQSYCYTWSLTQMCFLSQSSIFLYFDLTQLNVLLDSDIFLHTGCLSNVDMVKDRWLF